MVAVWLAYVVKVGGCSMEFRFIVPMIPFIMILLAWAFFESGAIARPVGAALALAVLAGSGRHMAAFEGGGEGIAPVSVLHGWTVGWEKIGRQLREDVGEEPVTIAVTAAGAIPCESGLRSIDMHGLCDKWVARHGPVIGIKPGHQRGATVEYLIDRDVNLVIGEAMWVPRRQPDAVWAPFARRKVMRVARRTEYSVDRARFVTIPVEGTDYRIGVWYLAPCDAVDKLVEDRVWGLVDLRVAGTEGPPVRRLAKPRHHTGKKSAPATWFTIVPRDDFDV